MWSHADILNALDYYGVMDDAPLGQISIDTRTLTPGDIFVCVKGENHNGHDYIETALENGASIIIADNADAVKNAEFSYLLVENTLVALEKMGAYARKMTSAKIIGVTGSAGKTTTKEFLNQMLAPLWKTTCSPKSYNNHLGVPLTLMQLEQDTDIGIIEMGMNNPGEIEPLSKMATPNIAIITNIAPAHIGHMGSLEAIAREKSTIFKGLSQNGTAILNMDTPHFDILRDAAFKNGAEHIITFGESDGADIRLTHYTPRDEGCEIKGSVFGEHFTLPMKMTGKHYGLTALICMAAGYALKMPLDLMIKQLKTIKPVAGRGGVQMPVVYENVSFSMIDDAYNANPESFKAGLTMFHETQTKGRKIAVMGEMLEMGEFSAQYHKTLGDFVNTLNIDHVFATGPAMMDCVKHISKIPVEYCENIDILTARVAGFIRSDDVVFVKGSNASGVHKLVDFFQNNLKKTG